MPKNRSYKLHVLISTYNDHVALPFALDSVKDSVDSIIVADGAYQLYYENYSRYNPKVKPWSTDGTLEMLRVIPDLPPIKLLRCPDGKPWRNQVVKRNALLNAVPDKEWFMVLDSDEMFYGNITEGMDEIIDSGCIQGSVSLYNVGLEMSGFRRFWHPRVFLKLPGLHYGRKHWYIYDFADRLLEADYPLWNTGCFVLAHLKVFKDFRRLAPHQSYMLQLEKAGWVEPHLDNNLCEVDKFED